MKWLLRYAIGTLLGTLLLSLLLFQYMDSGLSGFAGLMGSGLYAGPLRGLRRVKNNAYLVNTPTCRIPNLRPFDPSTDGLLGQPKNISCANEHSLTYQDGRTIYVNRTLAEIVPEWQALEYCTYQSIERAPVVGNHDTWFYSQESDRFTDSVEINFSEFIKISCYNQTNDVIFKNFYAFVHKKPHVEESCNEKLKKHQQDTQDNYNVLMLGIDSISRLNFHRFMPETTRYLLKKLHAIELKGYNKVADNTFVNIVPLTAGKFASELPWSGETRSAPFDKHNFLWKQYKEKGYRTLYIEDAPVIAIFDFGKAGFLKYPTHYYNRHFALAMEADKKLWRNGGHCILDRLETEVHLHYLEQFLHEFKSVPTFAFSFMTRLTHSALEETHYAEKAYLQLLQSLNNSGILDNTILVLYSDHGFRFGYLRQTYIGKLEERLPAMFIVFPEKFRKKYPTEIQNVQENAERLTTPFDIYQTLGDVLFMGSKKRKPTSKTRGISLFKEIPFKRTCDDAGILPHWCTCSALEKLPKSDEKAKTVADQLVLEINDLLDGNFNVCELLKLKDIKHIEKVVPPDKLLRFVKSENDVINVKVEYGESVKSYIDYQVTIVTDPGGAVFEGTIRYDEKKAKYHKVGDVSRINKYGNQSFCVQRHSLKKLCFCKNQTVT